jgi:Tol biopolymer transport system component
VLGTIGYMAPEQVRGEPADHRSDIFSLGVVLYHMLSGRRPFEAETAAETMTAILRHEPAELSELNPDLPLGLDRLVRHCIEKNPDERYQSARDLAFELEGRSWRAGSAQSVAVPAKRPRKLGATAIVGAMFVTVAVAAFFAGRGLTRRTDPAPQLTWHRQTFRHGNVMRAGFGPDGKTIVYGAAWEDKPAELFMTQTDNPGSTPLGIVGADLLAVSSKGELAIIKKADHLATTVGGGVLARLPLTGGAPRELLRDVLLADWSPDGEELAVVLHEGGQSRIEYPIGNVIHDEVSPSMQVSPDGRYVAFHVFDDSGGGIAIADHEGNVRTIGRGWESLGEGLLWMPEGEEILFSTGSRENVSLRAVDLQGNVRVLYSGPDKLVLHDITKDGRILIERESWRDEMLYSTAGGEEIDLSWLDGSWVATLSADGTTLLFSEAFTDDGKGIYIRGADGSPAIKLGEGAAWDLSPDGQWVLAQTTEPPWKLLLLPTGAGSSRAIDSGDVETDVARFLTDERIVYLGAVGDQDIADLYVQDIKGGLPQKIATGFDWGNFIGWSADRGRVAIFRRDGTLALYPIDGSDPQTIQGLDPNLELIQYDEDGRSLYLRRVGTVPAEILRYDLQDERLEPWRELAPSDRTGIIRADKVAITPDAETYAYTCIRITSSVLYVLEGID